MPTRSGIGISCLAAAAVVAAMVWLVLIVQGAHAHEGHDHGAPTNAVTTSLPRIAVQSDLYQLVGILEGGRLTLYLDRFSDNAPVTTGRIAVTVDGEATITETDPAGTFVVTSNCFAGNGSVELVFDISAADGDDLLIGTLALRSSVGNAAAGPASWPARILSAVRHAGEDHFVLVMATLLAGMIFGLAVRGRRRRAGCRRGAAAACPGCYRPRMRTKATTTASAPRRLPRPGTRRGGCRAGSCSCRSRCSAFSTCAQSLRSRRRWPRRSFSSAG